MLDLSLAADAFKTLGIEPPSPLSVVEAQSLLGMHVPPVPADAALLVTGLEGSLEAVGQVLRANYPCRLVCPNHPRGRR